MREYYLLRKFNWNIDPEEYSKIRSLLLRLLYHKLVLDNSWNSLGL